MSEVKILICGNDKKQEIISVSEKLKNKYNLNMLIKDCSNSTQKQNIEYFFSLINDIQYFNIFILNYEKKQEIYDFFEAFKSEDWGITNECYPFFIISGEVLPKIELKKFIENLNKSKDDEFKFKKGLFLFFREIEKSDNDSFQNIILKLYNCYTQDIIGYDDSEETINILLIGCKNSGKSTFINYLLGETRALSMENHFTTKINFYKHQNYPIVFYDISGFNDNEDEQVLNLDSKIAEFNKDYKNIKHKIHTIFYVIDCDSVRILQKKEKEIIENIFQINIPLFIVGQKGKKTNMQNFIRKTKFELSTFPEQYKANIEILKNRIFCLDSTKQSVLDLLENVYKEFVISQKINEEIFQTSSVLDNEEIINRSLSENIIINRPIEEERVIQLVFEKVKKSIFFNNLSDKLKEIYNNIIAIKDRYVNDTYYFTNPDLKALNREIENQFKDLFDSRDLNEIKKIIQRHQNELNIEGKNIQNLSNIYAGTGIGIAGVVVSSVFLTGFLAFIGIPILIADAVLLKKRNNTVKTKINENIESSYKRFEEKYILINIYLIRKKAEAYNKAINKFNEFLKDFEKDEEDE